MHDALDQSLMSFAKNMDVSVKQKLKVDEIFLVRFDRDSTIKYGDDSLDRNVYAFNESGEKIWQIEAAPVRQSPKLYVNLRVEKSGVVAESWTGIEVIINLKDGSVSTYNIGQRPW